MLRQTGPGANPSPFAAGPGGRPPEPRGPRRLAAPGCLAVALAVLPQAPFPYQDLVHDRVKEYEVKAAFLFNFARFVEWPPAALGEPEDPFVVGVLGADPFGALLDETLAGVELHGRPVSIRRIPSWGERQEADALFRCHLLFFSSSEERWIAAILKELRDRPVLTVGEERYFARMGGMVNFFIEARRVRFEVNPASVDKASLKMSSRLLRLARIVG